MNIARVTEDIALKYIYPGININPVLHGFQ